MWRTTYQIPRLIRNHRSGTFVRSSQQQAALREDSTENAVNNCQTTDLLKQISRPAQHPSSLLFIQRQQQYSGRDEQYKRGSRRRSAGSDWDEWFRAFRQDFCLHARNTRLIEAVGFSTFLLLGFHLSQYGSLWTERHLRCHNKPSDQAWLGYHLHQMALALPVIREQDILCARSQVLPSTIPPAIQPPLAVEYEGTEASRFEDARDGARKPKEPDKWQDLPEDWVKEWISVDPRATNIQTEEADLEHYHPTPDTELPAHNDAACLTEARQSWADLSQLYVKMASNLAAYQHSQSGDTQQALTLWRDSTDLPSSCYNLGVCYEFGQGTVVDMDKARRYYEAAASLGHPRAMCNLAGFCLRGEGGPRDLLTALDMYQKAAALNVSKAQTNLGVLYSMSRGGCEKAASLFEKAAASKDLDGTYNLALCYHHGYGVEENVCKAAELYSQAAQLGHAGAQCALADFFRHGLAGLPEDLPSATAWYQRAADQGYAEATARLSDLADLLDTTNHSHQSVYHGDQALCHGDQAVHRGDKSVHHGDKSVHHGDKSVHHGDKSVHHGDKSVHHGDKSIHHGDKSVHLAPAPDVPNSPDKVSQVQDPVSSVLDCLPREKYPIRKSLSQSSAQHDADAVTVAPPVETVQHQNVAPPAETVQHQNVAPHADTVPHQNVAPPADTVENLNTGQTKKRSDPRLPTDKKSQLYTITSEGLFGEERFPSLGLIGSFGDIQISKPMVKVKKKSATRKERDLNILRAFGVDDTDWCNWSAGTSALEEDRSCHLSPTEGVMESCSSVSTL